MLDFVYYNEKVAIHSAMLRRVAFAFERKHVAIRNTSRYREADLLLLSFDTFAVAMLAVFCDNFAGAVTTRALNMCLAQAKQCLLGFDNRTRAMTLRTCGKRCAVFSSCAVAVVTFDKCRYLECFCRAFEYVLKCEFDMDS